MNCGKHDATKIWMSSFFFANHHHTILLSDASPCHRDHQLSNGYQSRDHLRSDASFNHSGSLSWALKMNVSTFTGSFTINDSDGYRTYRNHNGQWTVTVRGRCYNVLNGVVQAVLNDYNVRFIDTGYHPRNNGRSARRRNRRNNRRPMFQGGRNRTHEITGPTVTHDQQAREPHHGEEQQSRNTNATVAPPTVAHDPVKHDPDEPKADIKREPEGAAMLPQMETQRCMFKAPEPTMKLEHGWNELSVKVDTFIKHSQAAKKLNEDPVKHDVTGMTGSPSASAHVKLENPYIKQEQD
ncbi:hypothetical protein CONLIGDRAFT_145726 [Coniochaeta ligniaria NRRL 30616]|uniref:Uncharacterized protein n=1 Tax=Coniochaeta ligniaria NRRL 30616 TaxID=1408157 RepID=A0A1J7I6A8_9PEZI|nr:hypothetical protein CONLIGDRAFT_145726 [Coniochaeta ligniaria NRRL 30616]